MPALKFGEGIRLPNGGFRYGPVRPGEEMLQRSDRFRSEYIAARSLAHTGSSGESASDLLTAISFGLGKLSKALNFSFRILENSINDAIGYTKQLRTSAARQWEMQDRSAIPDEERLGKTITGIYESTDTLFEDCVSGSKLANRLTMLVEDLKEEDGGESTKVLEDFRKRIILLRDFSCDRAAFIDRSNVWGETASIADIKERLFEGREGRLVITADNLEELTKAAMSRARLFSLANNLITNAFKWADKPGEVTLMISKTDEPQRLTLTVRNSGPAIPEEYFEYSDSGLLRLFSLEEKDLRIPVGLAEVWDIAGIQDAEICVVTEPRDRFNTFTVWLLVSD
ncbi:MAG: ATP-binding protein [Candidatus Margulisiibacteriota bacterium]